MDPNNEQNAEQTSQAHTEQPETQPNVEVATDKEKAFGPIVGIVIVVILFVLGGLYYFFGYNQTSTDLPSADEIRKTDDTVTSKLGEQSTSDEITIIEEDLTVDNFDDLDADLQNIDTELGL